MKILVVGLLLAVSLGVVSAHDSNGRSPWCAELRFGSALVTEQSVLRQLEITDTTWQIVDQTNLNGRMSADAQIHLREDRSPVFGIVFGRSFDLGGGFAGKLALIGEHQQSRHSLWIERFIDDTVTGKRGKSFNLRDDLGLPESKLSQRLFRAGIEFSPEWRFRGLSLRGNLAAGREWVQRDPLDLYSLDGVVDHSLKYLRFDTLAERRSETTSYWGAGVGVGGYLGPRATLFADWRMMERRGWHLYNQRKEWSPASTNILFFEERHVDLGAVRSQALSLGIRWRL